MKLLRTTIAAAAVAATTLPLTAGAASSFATGAGPQSTGVILNFSVAIPRFVFLRVGNPAGGPNTLVYAPTVTDIITPNVVAASGGDTGAGAEVTVQVRANGGGNVTLTAATGAGTLVSGSGNMPWSTLSGVVGSGDGTLTPPLFNSGNTTLLAVGGIVNQSATWRYTWNSGGTIYAADTYTGAVTYTAAMP